MANSFTANLNLEKPEVGADSNLWGGHINSDLDLLDSIFTTATTRPIASQILSSTRFLDATTTSKSILLVLSGITTTTGRNLTVQDADGVLAYTSQVAAATTGIVTGAGVAAATATLVALLAASAFTSTAVTGVTTTPRDNSTKFATTAYADSNLIQIVTTPVNSATSSANFTGTYALSGAAPTTGGGAHVTPFDTTFTPKNASSVLEIEVTLKGVDSVGGDAMTIALFNNTTLIDYSVNFLAGGTSNGIQNWVLKTYYSPGSTSAIPLKVYVGSTGGATLSLNCFNSSGGTQPSMISWLVVKEILPHL